MASYNNLRIRHDSDNINYVKSWGKSRSSIPSISKDVLVQGHGKAVEKGQNPKINSVGLALSLVIGKVKGKSKNLIRKMKIRKTRPRKNTLF